MRRAKRGGVASALNELAQASSVAMVVREAAVPLQPAVAGACEILGIDPMYVANEGVLVAFVAPEAAEQALAALVSGGLELEGGGALGAFVTGSRSGAARDATTGAAVAGTGLALLTAGLAAAWRPWEGWRAQGAAAFDCPFEGTGRNQGAGLGLSVSMLRVWP